MSARFTLISNYTTIQKIHTLLAVAKENISHCVLSAKTNFLKNMAIPAMYKVETPHWGDS